MRSGAGRGFPYPGRPTLTARFRFAPSPRRGHALRVDVARRGNRGEATASHQETGSCPDRARSGMARSRGASRTSLRRSRTMTDRDRGLRRASRARREEAAAAQRHEVCGKRRLCDRTHTLLFTRRRHAAASRIEEGALFGRGVVAGRKSLPSAGAFSLRSQLGGGFSCRARARSRRRSGAFASSRRATERAVSRSSRCWVSLPCSPTHRAHDAASPSKTRKSTAHSSSPCTSSCIRCVDVDRSIARSVLAPLV